MTPTTKADAETAIIEAVRAQDGVGGLRAFLDYRRVIEAEVRADITRQVAALRDRYERDQRQAEIDEAEFPDSRSGAPGRWKARAEGAAAVLALLQPADPLEGRTDE